MAMARRKGIAAWFGCVGALVATLFPSGTALSAQPRTRSFTLTGPVGAVEDPNEAVWRQFTQPLDHFVSSKSNAPTWRQRYAVNETFFEGTGPVFLCVGGEGPALKGDVVITGAVHCGLMMTLAKTHGALVFAVEHRYYGKSRPVTDLSTHNMRWLSSAQALADLAAFVQAMNAQYGLTADNKWVSWGGSYPGMMASWVRLKYPHLVHAAVASSAPVEAVANFEGYNDVVAAGLQTGLVGGSEECLQQVREAFADLGDKLTTASGRRELEAAFDVCGAGGDGDADGDGGPLEEAANRRVFADAAAAVFPAQENDPACSKPDCNIRKICAAMTNTTAGSPLARLAGLNAQRRQGACVEVAYANDIAALAETSFDHGGDRIWFYQTCTEFGFYQTCDPGSNCPFTSEPWLDTLASWYEQCEMAFGIDGAAVEEAVARTNRDRGGVSPPINRILYVNGEIDPWRAASVREGAPEEGRPALWVPGASHHFWTHPALPTDQPEILQARRKIANQVAEWLAMPADSGPAASLGDVAALGDVDGHGSPGGRAESRRSLLH